MDLGTCQSSTYYTYRSKRVADKILLTGDRPTIDRVTDFLGNEYSRKEVTDHLRKWRREQKSKGFKKDPEVTKLIQDSTEELKHSLSLVRATLESTADGILMINKQGKFVDWNQKFIDMSQVPQEILETGDENSCIKYMLSQVIEPEKLFSLMVKMQQNPEAIGDVGEVRMKDGRIVERYSQPHRVAGEIVGRVWSFRDVTEKRKAEQELRLRNRAIESSSHGVIIASNNANLTINYVNPAFEKITGYKLEDVISQGINYLFKDDLKQPEISKIRLAIKEKSEENVIVRSYRKDSTLFWNEMNIAPVPK